MHEREDRALSGGAGDPELGGDIGLRDGRARRDNPVEYVLAKALRERVDHGDRIERDHGYQNSRM